jgi:hypothetical protein
MARPTISIERGLQLRIVAWHAAVAGPIERCMVAPVSICKHGSLRR